MVGAAAVMRLCGYAALSLLQLYGYTEVIVMAGDVAVFPALSYAFATMVNFLLGELGTFHVQEYGEVVSLQVNALLM